MKKSLLVLSALAALSLGWYFWHTTHKPGAGTASEAAPISLGCLTPLTGDGATYGAATKRGVDLAVETINAGGGINGRKLTVIYEDDQMNPATAISGLRKLVSIHKVPAVIGAFGSSVTLAVAPVAEAEKTVLFSASSTADAIADAGDYIFRNVPTNRAQGITAAQFALTKLNGRTAAILSINNEYGKSLSASFKEAFSKGGGQVAVEDVYNSGDKDFRAQLEKIKQSNPAIVFYPGHYSESALILRQAKEVGITSLFIGGDGSYSPDLITVAGAAAEGSFYTLMAVDFDAEPAKSFASSFKSKFGEEPDVYAAYAYDAAALLGELLKRGLLTSEALKAGLYQTKNYPGITGSTSFDARGEVTKDFAVYLVKNGKFQPHLR